MNEEIKRYDLSYSTWCGGTLSADADEAKDGEWVKFDDIAHLLAARPIADAEEAVVEFELKQYGDNDWQVAWHGEVSILMGGLYYRHYKVGDKVKLYRAAPSESALSEAQAANLDLVIARLEQIAGNSTDDYRNSAAEALLCARAIASTSAPAEAGGPRFTSERPDILHAIYKGFQRGDSVERVHFDVCAYQGWCKMIFVLRWYRSGQWLIDNPVGSIGSYPTNRVIFVEASTLDDAVRIATGQYAQRQHAQV